MFHLKILQFNVSPSNADPAGPQATFWVVRLYQVPRKLGLSNVLTIQSKPEFRPQLAKPRKMLTLPRQHTKSQLSVSDFSQIKPWFNPPHLRSLVHIAMLVPQGLPMPTDDACNFLMYRLSPWRMAFASASGLCWYLTFCVCAGDWTWDLGHVVHTLYHWAISPVPRV